MDATEAFKLKRAGLSGLADPGFWLWQQTVALQFWLVAETWVWKEFG